MEQNSAPQVNGALTTEAAPTSAALLPSGKPAKRRLPIGWVVALLFSFGVVGMAGVFVAPHVLWMFGPKKGVEVAHETSTEGPFWPGLLAKIFGRYGQALESVQYKVDEIKRLEQSIANVSLENIRLRSLMERGQFECKLEQADRGAKVFRNRLVAETRTHIGRTLASIDYRIPEHLLPSQLYTLAVSYLQARDDEKAVKILNHLVTLQDVATYRNPKDYLLTGVAWYRIDNLEEADLFFAKVLEGDKGEESDEARAYVAQARLWRAIVAERSGKRMKSQFWMRELVDHHPHAAESQWVNSREARRAVAGSRKRTHHDSRH